jgi:hypothetical protein
MKASKRAAGWVVMLLGQSQNCPASWSLVPHARPALGGCAPARSLFPCRRRLPAPRTKRFLQPHCRGASILCLLFHSACLAWYISVWAWHTTPAASYLPGASGFGWFFRYLTFYSFTLQLVALLLGALDGVARLVRAAAPLLHRPAWPLLPLRPCALSDPTRQDPLGQHPLPPPAAQLHKSRTSRWSAWADDLSCALFALAHVVSSRAASLLVLGSGVQMNP